MKRKILSFLVLVVVFCSLVIVVHGSCSGEVDATTVVSRIIDGDTFDTSTEGRIRLADVDCPESGESGYYDAKQYLASLIDDETVCLDIDDLYGDDIYGRLVCVVYVEHNSTHYCNVNKALLVDGHAIVANYQNEFSPYSWSLYCPKEAIPEFSHWMPILPIFIVLLVAIALYARKTIK